MDDLRQVIGDYVVFLEQILQETTDAGFDLADFIQMDHMCYRVTSRNDYEAKQQVLRKVGKLLGKNQINRRPISTFRLSSPVLHKGWRIDTIELPAPKEDSTYREGLEHVEFVIYDDLEDFLKKYAHKKFEMKAADLHHKVSFVKSSDCRVLRKQAQTN